MHCKDKNNRKIKGDSKIKKQIMGKSGSEANVSKILPMPQA